MLSKEVCKRCNQETLHSWLELDERLWKKDEVFCAVLSVKHAALIKIDTKKTFPEECPFFLEHQLNVE